MLVRKTRVVPIECVVRGYLAGSGWAEYRKTPASAESGSPPAWSNANNWPSPSSRRPPKKKAATTSTSASLKWSSGSAAGPAEELRRRSIDVYRRGAEHAPRGS